MNDLGSGEGMVEIACSIVSCCTGCLMLCPHKGARAGCLVNEPRLHKITVGPVRGVGVRWVRG